MRRIFYRLINFWDLAAEFAKKKHESFTTMKFHHAQCRMTTLLSCYLVLSTLGALATVFTSLLHCFLSVVTSLSSASFIPVTSCISSIHLLLSRPLLLLPSLCDSIIPFSNPSGRITCPKNPNFLPSAVCCSVSSSSIPISMRTLSLVFFSAHDILCIFLQIHISHALIFFHFCCHCPRLTAIQNCRGNQYPYYPFFVFMLTCLSRHNFFKPIIVAFPIVTLYFTSLAHFPSFSTYDPRNVKLVTTSISSPSISKLSQMAVVIIFVSLC